MSSVDEVIHDALFHYSDRYYDPQKAHDYYIRTRQLHPRQASIKGQAQTEALSYATKQIQNQRAAQLAALKKQHEAQIKQILASVKTYVDQQAAKLNHPPAGLTEQQTRQWVTREKMLMRRARAEIATKIHAAIAEAQVNYANAVAGVNKNYTKTLATERTKISEHVPVTGLKGGHNARKKAGTHKGRHRGKNSKTGGLGTYDGKNPIVI